MAHLDTKVAQLCPTLCDPMDYTMPQLEKNLPAMQDTWVRSLGWEDPLEKGKATHSSILAWKIPWTVQDIVHSHKDLGTTERLSLHSQQF